MLDKTKVKEALRILNSTGYTSEDAPMNYGMAMKIINDLANSYLKGELVERILVSEAIEQATHEASAKLTREKLVEIMKQHTYKIAEDVTGKLFGMTVSDYERVADAILKESSQKEYNPEPPDRNWP